MDIDFVIPWVDGNDTKWLEEKKKYEPYTTFNSKEANTSNRYRDWNLLKYWFRGVETYAPWVRNIHFLTWGHIPSFLKTDHPKLHIVNHKDFIPLDALPTYSSPAIEMCLHNIKGLSEHFVYFNDDMFLIRNVKKNDFFINGLPVEYFEESPCFHIGNSMYEHWMRNALFIVNKHFNKHAQVKLNKKKWFKYISKSSFINTLLSYPWKSYVGFPASHLPAPFLKSTWFDIWSKEEIYLKDTVYSKFRSSLNVEQDLFRFWQFAECNFENAKIDGHYFSITKSSINEIYNVIKKQTYKEICLNDDCENDAFDICQNKIRTAFELILPHKSSFEK